MNNFLASRADPGVNFKRKYSDVLSEKALLTVNAVVLTSGWVVRLGPAGQPILFSRFGLGVIEDHPACFGDQPVEQGFEASAARR
jgi:hypothetical protein